MLSVFNNVVVKTDLLQDSFYLKKFFKFLVFLKILDVQLLVLVDKCSLNILYFRLAGYSSQK